MAEIGIRQDFERWLKGKPREVAVTLAARCALRAIPLWPAILGGKIDADRRAAILLPVFRATAAACVAALGPTQAAEVRRAADAADAADADAANAAYAAARAATAADDAATAAADAATANAATAADAATAAADAATANAATAAATANAAAAAAAAAAADARAARAIWRAVSADCNDVQPESEDMADDAQLVARARALAAEPVWPVDYLVTKDGERVREPDGRFALASTDTPEPDWAREGWQALKAALLEATGEHWEVWTDWYDARLRGDPPDMALEEARVLLDAENDFALWDKGPAEVNAALKALIERHRPVPSPEVVAAWTPLARRIEMDGAAGRLTSRPPLPREEAPGTISNTDFIANVRRKLTRQLAHFADRREYGIEDVTDLVRDAVAEGNTQPLVLHDDCEEAMLLLDAKVARGELPEPEKAPELGSLRRELDKAVVDVREVYPEIRSMALARRTANLRSLTPEEQAVMEKAVAAFEAIVDTRLKEEVQRDLEEVKKREAGTPVVDLPEGPARWHLYDLAGTLARIMKYVRMAPDKLRALFDSGIDAVKRLREFEKARETLEPYWAYLKSWYDDLLSGSGGGPLP